MVVGLLFFIESKVNAVLRDTILEHFHLQTSFMEMPVFLSTCPQSQRYYQKFADCCITLLGWLINMSDDNSTEKLSRQDNVKRKMRNTLTQMLFIYLINLQVLYHSQGSVESPPLSTALLAVVSGLQDITQISADQTTRELVESVNLDTGSLLSNAFPPPEKTT